jgi:penicillin-binding protein 2
VAKLKTIDISGKTGTAQVVSREKLEDRPGAEDIRKFKDHAWFVAYAPSDAPRIAIAVIVEHGEHGSSAASPIARELVNTYLGPEEEHLLPTAPAAVHHLPSQGDAGNG